MKYPLSLDHIRAVAPSVFAEGAHSSRSERYVYIPTIEPLKALMEEGFLVYSASQSRTRVAGKAEFTKHMLRLRHRKDMEVQAKVGGYVDEVIWINSHDGTSAAHLRAGVYRFVCSNGMVVPENEHTNLKVYHKGNAIEQNHQIIEAAYEVLSVADKTKESVEVMRSVSLDRGVKLALADAALAVKYGDETPKIAADQVLRPSRNIPEDHGDTAWQVFNVLQYNIVEKGGITPRTRNARRTRPIRGIDQNVKVNAALWGLADAVARQLAA